MVTFRNRYSFSLHQMPLQTFSILHCLPLSGGVRVASTDQQQSGGHGSSPQAAVRQRADWEGKRRTGLWQTQLHLCMCWFCCCLPPPPPPPSTPFYPLPYPKGRPGMSDAPHPFWNLRAVMWFLFPISSLKFYLILLLFLSRHFSANLSILLIFSRESQTFSLRAVKYASSQKGSKSLSFACRKCAFP